MPSPDKKNKQIGKLGRSNELDNGHGNVKISGLLDFVDPTLYPEKGPKVGHVSNLPGFSPIHYPCIILGMLPGDP